MMNKGFASFYVTLILVLSALTVSAQNDSQGPPQVPAPTPSNLIAVIEKNISSISPDGQVSRENREQAYAKLLEGQRHLWKLRRTRSETSAIAAELAARNALLKAVELDPKLAEGYTALAELELQRTKPSFDDVIMLSQIAVKLDKDNFGAHRILARLYTLRSNVGRGKIDPGFAAKAIDQWSEIGRLDPRSAEAWAFLSALYGETNNKAKRLESLKKWIASAAPVETSFYSSIMRNDGELQPESASTKLGGALLEAGEPQEALEILTRAVSDDPSNAEALDLLGQALENADPKFFPLAIEALRQAVFANPNNQTLVQLLADTIAKNGQTDDAIRVLQDAIDKSVNTNKYSASKYQLAIGDIFADSNRTDEAIEAYKKALEMRGIQKDSGIAADDKDFAIRVINKIVNALRKANRGPEAERLLDDSRGLFGKNDTEIEKQRIDLLLSFGKKVQALEAARSARLKAPEDIGLLRREASILVGLDRVDEGTSLVKKLITNKPESSGFSILYDDFSNYLFLSSLYLTAKQEKLALEALYGALDKAGSNKENRQIAKLNLAFLQQTFGHYDAAEKNLREILDKSPGYPIALNNLGYLLLRQDKNLNEALELIARAVRIEPLNPSYLDSLGWAYYKLGQLDAAEQQLKRAFRINSTSPTILEHLGDVYRQRGKLNEAKEVWQKALDFASNTDDSERIKTKLNR
ncbi:MAG: tetratricopeptide repeat protein [Acidobacteria bacterium]|nr:tetratricopeptide repeat protein [Acidobacteriota bacterium]